MATHDEQKVTVITGGGTGIGREIARQHAGDGRQVVITGRREAKLNETKGDNPNIHVQVADMTNPDDVARVFAFAQTLGPVVRVVHSAATFLSVRLREATDEQIATSVEELRMTYLVVRGALQAGVKEAVLISSFGGIPSLVFPERSLYSGPKVAMLGVGMAVSQEEQGVKFVIICPAAVDTEMGQQAALAHGGSGLEAGSALSATDVARAIERGLEETEGSLGVYKIWQDHGAPQFAPVAI